MKSNTRFNSFSYCRSAAVRCFEAPRHHGNVYGAHSAFLAAKRLMQESSFPIAAPYEEIGARVIGRAMVVLNYKKKIAV